jgi:septal ring factor EnvC (AmiA/AmiB activator)
LPTKRRGKGLATAPRHICRNWRHSCLSGPLIQRGKDTLTRAGQERRRHPRLYAALANVIITLITLLLPPAGAAAQSQSQPQPTKPAADAKKAEEAKKKLDAKRLELQGIEKRTKSLQGDVETLTVERERLNSRLVDTAALIKKSEGELTTTETRLGELEAQEKLLRGSLAQSHGQIAKLLSALQRMGRNPPPVLITQREDALKMVRSAMLLASAFPELGTQARALAARLTELLGVMTEIRSQGERLKAEMGRLNDARVQLSSLLEAKKASLDERQSELKRMRTEAAQISANVTDLNELIAKLDQAVKQNTALGEYEKETKEAAKHSSDAPASGPDADKSGRSKSQDVVELHPGVTLGNPGRIKPEIPFAEAKGRLPMPAQGRQVLRFGEKTQYGGQSKGIVLETRLGAQVTSPCDGWIVYAGEFRSYGQLLIINAGGGYHVLLAGLSQIDVQPGQFVLAAEPVGTMNGWSQEVQPAAVSSAPVLYLEFRKDGAPIDPDPWWDAGHQKVQG